MTPHPYERAVNYYETDRMGVVHHSNYLRYFEEARVDLLAQLGYPYHAIEETGLMTPVLTSACEYKSPLQFNEFFRVYTWLESYNGLRMTLCYQIERIKDDAKCAEGKTSHCFVSASGFRPVRLSRAYPALDGALCELLQTGRA